MATDAKKALVEEIRSMLKAHGTFVLTEYQGMSVAQITKLRRQLREKGVVYQIIKNNLLRIALEGEGISGLDGLLVGPTAVAFIKEDVVTLTKNLADFQKEVEHLKLKGGYYNGAALNDKDVKAYASLPSKEELYSKLLGTLQSPISGVVRCLHGPLGKLARTLAAVADKKS